MRTDRADYREIEAKLTDEESRILFRARADYLKNRDYDAFMAVVSPLLQGRKLVSYELMDLLKRFNTNRVILFGAGIVGHKNRIALELAGLKIAAFSDNDRGKWGKTLEGIPVVPPGELLAPGFQDAVLVISTIGGHEEIEEGLLKIGFGKDRIHIPVIANGIVSVISPDQYFDVFRPGKDEVFVDAGAFDGQTARAFARWSGGSYRKIFCLEPLPEMIPELRKNTGDLRDVVICPCAAWNKKEELFLENKGSGSKLGETGILVSAERMDDLIKEEVTFIKLDIEGSEREALEGAERLITAFRPRLAVSIYHKPEDIFTIPSYLLGLVPEYRFTIRHYSGCLQETVLYASTGEN